MERPAFSNRVYERSNPRVQSKPCFAERLFNGGSFSRPVSHGITNRIRNEFQATLTNVCLSSQGLDFSLDVREVDADDVGILTDKISTQLQDIIPEGLSGLNKVSEKIHQKIDKSLRDRAKKVADIL